jgi:DUF1680 family protein
LRFSDYKINNILLSQVSINDNFWTPKLEINQKITIPHVFKQLEKTESISNFIRATGKLNDGKKPTFPHEDSDVFKAIEGAAYSLILNPNTELEAYIDNLIKIIADAQESDGYLTTARTIDPKKPHIWIGKNKWDLVSIFSHELYNLGHLIESGIAYYQATKKPKLLNIAIKSADLISKDFGFGKIERFPGHQEIELALIKLFKITDNEKYLNLAKFFLDIRASKESSEYKDYLSKFDSFFPFPYAKDLKYNQTHKKIIEQDEAVGHAVRLPYMFSAATDLVAILEDNEYRNAINRVWDNIVSKKLYITGGIGARSFIQGEGFRDNYDLPNFDSYCETCAAIGNIFWNHRLFLLKGEAKYIDILERTLYNGFLVGISLDGKAFFYNNPLASKGKFVRKQWFKVPCCPTNIIRFLPQIPSFIYGIKGRAIFVNLFIGNNSKILLDGEYISLEQKTNYPWEGNVKVVIKHSQKKEFSIALRIPGWARNKPIPSDLYYYLNRNNFKPIIKINHELIDFKVENGYAEIHRVWQDNDLIELNIPMPIRRVLSNKKVEENIGKVAVERGPILYCIESIDNKRDSIFNLSLDDDDKLRSEYREDILGGVIIVFNKLNLIPYYSWANRGKSEMIIWIPHNSLN